VPTLQSLVKTEGPLGFRYAVTLLQQVVLHLTELHAEGRVHGGVSPFTVQINRAGCAQLEDAAPELTPEFMDYLPPEMALHAGVVDPKADIYSLGCTFYFALSGRPPLGEGTVSERLLHHQVTQPDPLSSHRRDVPVELEDLCHWMLQKKPSQRPQLGEVQEKLHRWLQTASE
jgi:hypothetical protein